jgi:hypothetical protein
LGFRRAYLAQAAADRDPVSRRKLMSELGKGGAKARMSKAERQRIAKKARKTRRRNCQFRSQLHRLSAPEQAHL